MAKFVVRARAVDMLGRQQIAGIPTAIHELFKNAYDAYATRIEVDYVRESDVLIIRDDGLGMTREDIETRWLALGTESRVPVRGQSPNQTWTGPKKLPVRPVLGEKGIGRLAIATIAPITLVMSRSVRRETGVGRLVCAMVCWELFEIPGLDINLIDIPIEEFDALPNETAVERMRLAVLSNATSIIPPDWSGRTSTINNIESFAVDPVAFEEWLAGTREDPEKNLSLSGDAYGTHFYLSPVSPELAADLVEKEKDFEAPSLKKVLLGFGNILAPNSTPPIETAFRDHLENGGIDEVIGGTDFFVPQDFHDSDHLIDGTFDEMGTFRGTIQIYGHEPKEYVLTWPDGRGHPTECGAFKVRLAALQGDARESSSSRHADLLDKMYRYGGFYVYLDGIRVLPYGQADVDWLHIERRRTMKASTWFFSHRRMIGYIALERPGSAALVEKAGREGFRQNLAYRQLKSILEAWLKQIATDYFREGAEFGQEFREIREGLKREAELLARRKKSVHARKKELVSTLNSLYDRVENREPEDRLRQIVQRFDRHVQVLSGSSIENIRSKSIELEITSRQEIENLISDFHLPSPRGFALSKRDALSFGQYQDWISNFQSDFCAGALSHIAAQISELRRNANVEVDRHLRATSSLATAKAKAEKLASDLRREVEGTLQSLDKASKSLLRERQIEFRNSLENVVASLVDENLDSLTEDDAFNRQKELEKQIADTLEIQESLLRNLAEQFRSLRTDIIERTTTIETITALEGRIAWLEDELASWRDLAQAGSAIGILSHETGQLVGGIRRAINTLKSWADITPDLKPVYRDLRDHFDHIDGLLGLFAPLGRRLRRQKTEITGKVLIRYIRAAFEDRAIKENIALEFSPEFERLFLFTYMSTILAALVNIIDNAVYWITSEQRENRRVWLDADETGLLIGNNGPGIPLSIAGQIFEFGVSMKPDGRGMGLTVSRDALRSAGMDLSLVQYGRDNPPIFRIECNDPDGTGVEGNYEENGGFERD